LSTRLVHMTGFAFVYMKDKRDGQDAIDALDGWDVLFPAGQKVIAYTLGVGNRICI
jgi:hypothetical protein